VIILCIAGVPLLSPGRRPGAQPDPQLWCASNDCALINRNISEETFLGQRVHQLDGPFRSLRRRALA
jgi:hypothetical protein